ncbi:transmembrane protein [Ceratobasidium sp. AG-Ba]|nr:transmembrane protein [Ceratobasidium sp. AG-Ba]
MATLSPAASSQEHSSPGAGPSRSRPSPIPIPTLSALNYLAPEPAVRTRTPIRAATSDQEVELGVHFSKGKDIGTPPFVPASASPSRSEFAFHRRPSVVSISQSKPSKSVFLNSSEWRTDIVTFCSHARLDSALGQAKITHIQARKSRRPPFLHEYILVFFTTSNDQRFVARIDRLGKIGSTSGEGLLGWCAGRHGQVSNTAIQQVGVYHIQDSQIGVDSPEGAWFAYDGAWGSHPIATLIAWPNVDRAAEPISHHMQTATARDGPIPRLCDVSRLLEAILLEMPTYHLTTTNCYFMTRSSLLLLNRCFPSSFACFMGSTSGDLVASSELAEPIWAGLLRWYLPFVITVFLFYFPMLVLAHITVSNGLRCGELWVCPIDDTLLGPDKPNTMVATVAHMSRLDVALRLAPHGLVDVALPAGILHAWMTALEVEMNNLVTRLSAEYQKLEKGISGSVLLVDP